MSEPGKSLTAGQVRQMAQDWYERQVQRLQAHHGPRWPALEAWLKGYLREEIRQRLIARGWSVRRT
jgi:hypothetical protein